MIDRQQQAERLMSDLDLLREMAKTYRGPFPRHAAACEAGASALAREQEMVEALRAYVDWFGAAHVVGCPADDTCFCSGSAINDAVNKVLAKAEIPHD